MNGLLKPVGKLNKTIELCGNDNLVGQIFSQRHPLRRGDFPDVRIDRIFQKIGQSPGV